MHSIKKNFESIILTHVINPHMFWFRPESSYCSNEKYLALEESLYQHFQGSTTLANNRREFGVGEVVAVFMDTWGKWIRVVVDRTIKMVHGKTKCILWAIDWGFPLQAESERLRPLPIECAAFEPQGLYFGGLHYILPSETMFDFTLLQPVNHQSKEWSELVVKEFRKLIDQASNIKFIPDVETGNSHTFGRLEITTHNGIVIDANDVLLQIPGVMQMENSKQFLEALNDCNTTKIFRYHDNLNRLSFSDLNYNKVTSKALDMEYKIDNDFFNEENAISIALPSRNIVDKVVDWDRRNYEANSVTGKSDGGSENGTLVLDDDAFDSISCYDALNVVENDSSKSEKDIAKDDNDEEDECFVKRGHQIRIEIQKNYQKQRPRAPKIPFELPQSGTDSEPSAYIKKILDKRKKLIEMEKSSNSSPLPLSNESDSVSLNSSSKTSSYLDKIKEKGERALKAVENKKSGGSDTIETPVSVRHNNSFNSDTNEEHIYTKEEEERREKLRQSRRGDDRNVGFYPVCYPIAQITKEIQESKKANAPKNNGPSRKPSQTNQNYYKPQNADSRNGQYQQRCQSDHEKQYYNKLSLQQRLEKYHMSNNSNSNGVIPEHSSEADSEVW